MVEPNARYDLIVVGAGMVGAAFACACTGKGLSIALVEPRVPQRTWPEGEVDLRVSALSRASQRVLTRLGAWERIVEMGASPYREMHVWEGLGHGSIHFDSADLGESDLGHIVENRVTQLALWERLECAPEVTLVAPASCADLNLGPDAAILTLGDGTCISGRLLVAADGRDSWVRERAGITSSGWDYDQHAIVANVTTTDWHAETAYQRFLPTGPLAFLPLRDGRCSIVWSVQVGRAATLMDMPEPAFGVELADAFDRRLGDILAVGPRASIQLRVRHADMYVRPRLALVGDAAHAVHPLAGQGVNLGFLDAAVLADALDQAMACGRDPGGLWALRRYERARRGGNLAMLAAMDGFKRLFSNDSAVLAALRGWGLTLTDGLPPIKHLFMAQALGLGGGLPPLARP
jgi:2-polyprenylphenol 6-hydroxylase